jgi:hypothetical protein
VVDGVALLEESELALFEESLFEESLFEEVSSFLELPFAWDPDPFA